MNERYVYFVKPVGMDGPIKIGCSVLPEERLLSLSVWSPFPLELIGAVPGRFEDELFLHQCFAGSHSHREWFLSSPALRDAISKIIAAKTVDCVRATLSPDGSIRRPCRKPRSPEMRRYLSYAARVRTAEKRLRVRGEDALWSAPQYVEDIISRWSRGGEPSSHEMFRLEEYLRDPPTHSTHPSWWKPSPARSAA